MTVVCYQKAGHGSFAHGFSTAQRAVEFAELIRKTWRVDVHVWHEGGAVACLKAEAVR